MEVSLEHEIKSPDVYRLREVEGNLKLIEATIQNAMQMVISAQVETTSGIPVK